MKGAVTEERHGGARGWQINNFGPRWKNIMGSKESNVTGRESHTVYTRGGYIVRLVSRYAGMDTRDARVGG